MQLKSGALLQGGKYKIEKVLGQGGFGITYLGVQVALNRKVAIKEFFMKEYCEREDSTSYVSLGTSGSHEMVERFRLKFIKEAQTIAVLHHPHIISIYDIFEENGTAYYVMEYISHGSLSDLVKERGQLSEEEALHYIRQIADALGYIHERNMNHLDIKPSNILLDDKKNAVLIDFGLSKRYDEEGNQTSTTPVGISHGYAPIEQYKKGGVGTFSPQADIYALGATLYKLVTRNTPPQAIEIFNDGLSGLPQSLSSNLANAIRKAMQLKKNERPQSIKEFLNILNDFKTYQKASSSTVSKPSSNETTVLTKPTLPKNEINGHEYVDLGLPSGLKWATCNVGANRPEECGDYFAWGEVKIKRDYTSDNYEYSALKKGFFGGVKRVFDNIGNNISGTQYDAAKLNWGNSWRLPTEAEIRELLEKCIWTWTTQGSKKGYKVTGLNGNSIFLPVAGWYNEFSFCGYDMGSFWSANPLLGNGSNSAAVYLEINSNNHNVSSLGCRDHGRNVRPVSN